MSTSPLAVHNIPIRFHPFNTDGSTPPNLRRAFLKDFVVFLEILTKKEIEYQGEFWELILDNPAEIIQAAAPTVLEGGFTSRPLLEVIVSFQEWLTNAGCIRLAIIRERKY